MWGDCVMNGNERENARRVGGVVTAASLLLAVMLFCILAGAAERLWDTEGARDDHFFAALAQGERPVFVIDPGHGGVDGGAVGVDGIVEKELNLAIALKLRDMLNFWGCETVMTRETDISIHSPDAKTIREMKTSDLHNRLAIVEETPGAVYIGIHQNMFGQSRYDGAQIFYGSRCEESGRLARILQESLVNRLQPDNIRQEKEADKNLFLLCSTEAPAVLIECGFISNPQEAALLGDEEYQNKLVFVIFTAIAEYLAGSSVK